MATVDDWSDRSKRGEVCNMFGCHSKPSSQCPTCSHHFCYDRIQTHDHIISEEEIDEQTRMDENLR